MPPRKRGKAAAAKSSTTTATPTVTTTATSADTKPGMSTASSAPRTGGRATRKKFKASDPAEEAQSKSPSAAADTVTTTTAKSANGKAASSASKQKQTKKKPTRPEGGTKRVGAPPGKRGPIKPDYDDVWKHVYLAGTEWDQMRQIYSIDWDFDHLDLALTSGDLVSSAEESVYLFGATEPQLVPMREGDTKGEVVPIPTIIAVVSRAAPPSMVGLKSVQKAVEEIVDMSELRIGWQPYIAPNIKLGSRRKGSKPQVQILACSQRRARLRNMQEEAVHRYDYVLPYFFDPAKQQDAIEETEVQVLVELEGMQAPLMCEFDYEMDEVDEFIDEKMEENEELDAGKHKEALKKAIQDAVKAAKDKVKAEKAERKKKLDAITPEEKEAIKNTKLVKFYPLNEWPDISKCKSPYINRYYGKAGEVRDEYPDDDEEDGENGE